MTNEIAKATAKTTVAAALAKAAKGGVLTTSEASIVAGVFNYATDAMSGFRRKRASRRVLGLLAEILYCMESDDVQGARSMLDRLSVGKETPNLTDEVINSILNSRSQKAFEFIARCAVGYIVDGIEADEFLYSAANLADRATNLAIQNLKTLCESMKTSIEDALKDTRQDNFGMLEDTEVRCTVGGLYTSGKIGFSLSTDIENRGRLRGRCTINPGDIDTYSSSIRALKYSGIASELIEVEPTGPYRGKRYDAPKIKYASLSICLLNFERLLVGLGVKSNYVRLASDQRFKKA